MLNPAVLCLLLVAELPDETLSDALRYNQLQCIGTHNSYHIQPDPAKLQFLRNFSDGVREWEYTHAPLDEQLQHGVRSFELDIHYTKEGWKVFHMPGMDDGTTCPLLSECLAVIRAWSTDNPRHIPIAILLEIKDEAIALSPAILPITAQALDKLDNTIRSVVPEEALLSPDDLRGNAPTLEAAVLQNGWPLLKDCRGTLLFELHETNATRDLYTEGRPNLEGRAIFSRSDPGRSDAAFLIRDNPRSPDIPSLVQRGYLVRTRADSGLRAGAKNDTQGREAALASGAQLIHTDFPPGEAHPQTGYVVQFPGSTVLRINPVNGPRTE